MALLPLSLQAAEPVALEPVVLKPVGLEPVVLVTIKPLAWLVRSLAPAGADVQVLIPDGQSPHDYPLRPADMVRIQRSALLVWVGPGLEPWLVQTAGRLSSSQQLAFLPHSLHEHEEHSEEEGHEQRIENDPHLWLDPQAMRAQVAPLAAHLKQLYPAQVDEIDSRAAQLSAVLNNLDQEIGAQLKPVQAQGFVVYHDGYQRLVQRYHLNQRAAVWHHESIPAGAKERAALLALLNGNNVACLFYEPEHGRDAVNGWLGNASTKVKMVELDPLGEHVADSADAYERFMRDLVGKMVGCLQ